MNGPNTDETETPSRIRSQGHPSEGIDWEVLMNSEVRGSWGIRGMEP